MKNRLLLAEARGGGGMYSLPYTGVKNAMALSNSQPSA